MQILNSSILSRASSVIPNDITAYEAYESDYSSPGNREYFDVVLAHHAHVISGSLSWHPSSASTFAGGVSHPGSSSANPFDTHTHTTLGHNSENPG